VDTPAIGELVRFNDSGPALDGIVFDTPSRLKVVVAIVIPGRGPGFRTVHPDALTARKAEGTDDQALRSLIRRTPAAVHGNGRGGLNVGKGAAGFTRGASHRTTGR
jgi:hypothetical protein